MAENSYTINKKSGLLNLLMFRYLPYWPLFVSLVLASCAIAWYYIHLLPPMYEATTTLLIKEDKQGAGDAKASESLSFTPSNKNLKNEIEILNSKNLMKEVVEKLQLYAPVFEESRIKQLSAYSTSPIIIKVKDPDKLTEQDKVSFSYNEKDHTVKVDNHVYPLDVWSTTLYGTLMFSKNDRQESSTGNPLYFSLIKPRSMVNVYLSSLNISPVDRDASVVLLSIKDNVSRRAEDILNSLTEAYGKSSIADKNALAINTLAFLQDRIKYVENDLDSLEKKIEGYKTERGIVDLSSQGKIFLENVSANDQKVASINIQLAVLDQVERYVMYKDKKNGLVPATLGIQDPLLTELLQKLYDAEVQYEKLRKTSAENNPALITIKSEIEQIRPSILEIIQNQRASLQASIRKINTSNNTYNSVLSKIPQQEKNLLDFSRRQGIKSSVYTYLLQKREETALSLSSSIADNKVIDSAEAYAIPNGPSQSIIYLLAIGLGILLSIAAITVKDYGNTKILFRSEIESFTTVPIVAEITKVNEKLSLVVNNPKYVFIAEQFRQLRAAIGLHGKKANKIKLLVTSSISGEGKSFVCANLALSLALAGKKVMLIDLDLRNPKITEIFGLRSSKGAAEYLEGDAETFEVIKQTSYGQLFVVPSGKGNANPTELLLNGKLELLFSSLEEMFDYIIVDTSPIEPVTDAYVLSQYCDAVLFVIRHGFTPKTTVQLLDESNKIKALKNLAIVFNGVKSRGFTEKGYGYGYGYGYDKLYQDQSYTKRSNAGL